MNNANVSATAEMYGVNRAHMATLDWVSVRVASGAASMAIRGV